MSGHGPMGGGGPRGPGQGGPGRGIERAKNPRETIARLASYLLVYKFQIALVVISIVVAGTLQLLGPYLIGVTIDQYILKGYVPGLVRMSLILLGVYLGGWAMQATQGWIMATDASMTAKMASIGTITSLLMINMVFPIQTTPQASCS